jgi:hypothetical protein
MDNHKGEQSFVQKMLEEKEAARRNLSDGEIHYLYRDRE